jgi:hypothetical protein
MLKVRLIGKFDIQFDGKLVILSSRAAQSLFAYLILIQADNTKSVGIWILALPLLALILVIFSMSRMRRKLEVLDEIRKVHRGRQSGRYPITWKGGGHFTRDVMLYLIGLAVLCIIDMISISNIFFIIYKIRATHWLARSHPCTRPSTACNS